MLATLSCRWRMQPSPSPSLRCLLLVAVQSTVLTMALPTTERTSNDMKPLVVSGFDSVGGPVWSMPMVRVLHFFLLSSSTTTA